jgi:hypothetical protein
MMLIMVWLLCANRVLNAVLKSMRKEMKRVGRKRPYMAVKTASKQSKGVQTPSVAFAVLRKSSSKARNEGKTHSG